MKSLYVVLFTNEIEKSVTGCYLMFIEGSIKYLYGMYELEIPLVFV